MQEKLEHAQKTLQEKNGQMLQLQMSLDEKEADLLKAEDKIEQKSAELAQLQTDLDAVCLFVLKFHFCDPHILDLICFSPRSLETSTELCFVCDILQF